MICRQAGAAGGFSRSTPRTEETGGERMSDYEMLIIVLTILALLIAVDHRNDR